MMMLRVRPWRNRRPPLRVGESKSWVNASRVKAGLVVGKRRPREGRRREGTDAGWCGG